MSENVTQENFHSYVDDLMELKASITEDIPENILSVSEWSPLLENISQLKNENQTESQAWFPDLFEHHTNLLSHAFESHCDSCIPENDHYELFSSVSSSSKTHLVDLWNSSSGLDNLIKVPNDALPIDLLNLHSGISLSNLEAITDTSAEKPPLQHASPEAFVCKDISAHSEEIQVTQAPASSFKSRDAVHSDSNQIIKETPYKFVDYQKPEIKPKPLANYRPRPETQSTFNRFSSLLGHVTSHNCSVFLVECLKDHHAYVSLDDLFRLLYDRNSLDSELSVQSNNDSSDSSGYIGPQFSGLDFCHLILETFHSQRYGRNINTPCPKDMASSSVNLQELYRNFLAIKILFLSFRRCNDRLVGKFCIPKSALYKVYYIICQKLIARHSTNTKYRSEDVVMSPPNLGRLANLIYPNLSQKRVGRRGSSRFYYIGLTWNPDVVDDNVIPLLALELPQLKRHFRIVNAENDFSSKNMSRSETAYPAEKGDSVLMKRPSPSINLPTLHKPLHSFVEISQMFPSTNCSPRMWTSTPNEFPQQSQWSRSKMEQSVAALGKYNVSLTQIIQDFKMGLFSEDGHEGLSKSIIHEMNYLERASAPKDAYLHLYFVVLSMVFPVVMASDTEVNVSLKGDFRLSVRNCISKLESKSANFACKDETSLRTFIAILNRMMRLSEMTSCKIIAPYKERVLQEMITHIETALTVKPGDLSDNSPSDNMYSRSIIIAMHSYGFTLTEPTKRHNSVLEIIDSTAKAFTRTLMHSKDDFGNILQHVHSQESSFMQPDVPFQALRVALMNFHDLTLKNSLVSKLPMVAVMFIVHNFTSSMQNGSLDDFRKGDTAFAKEFFKFCWIFSVMYQEYVKILGEVVTLGEILSQKCLSGKQ